MGKHTSGFWGFLAGSYLGKTPGSQNEKWQEPHSTYKHTQGPGAFGRGLLGEISGSRNEKWQGPIYTKKGRKKKKKKEKEKGEGIRKNTGVVENPNTRVR